MSIHSASILSQNLPGNWKTNGSEIVDVSLLLPYSLPALPLIQSAIKRARQNTVRQERRKPVKTYMKTMIRKVNDSVQEGKKDEAKKMLPEAFKAIDMAQKRDIIHRNNAARKKSQLSKLVEAK